MLHAASWWGRRHLVWELSVSVKATLFKTLCHVVFVRGLPHLMQPNWYRHFAVFLHFTCSAKLGLESVPALLHFLSNKCHEKTFVDRKKRAHDMCSEVFVTSHLIKFRFLRPI